MVRKSLHREDELGRKREIQERNLLTAHCVEVLQLDNNTQVLSHFNEVIRRHHALLADKNRQIDELQQALAGYRRAEQVEPTSDWRELIDDGRNYRNRYRLTQSVIKLQDTARNTKDMKAIKHNSITKNGRVSNTELPLINQENFSSTRSLASEDFRKTHHKSLINKDDFRIDEPAISHITINGKSKFFANKINFKLTNRSIDDEWSSDQLGLDDDNFRLKKQMISKWNSSRNKQKEPDKPSFGQKHHKVIDNLNVECSCRATFKGYKRRMKPEGNMFTNQHTRQNFPQTETEKKKVLNRKSVAPLANLQQDFMRRLEFEERLDRLHWQIEASRLSGGYLSQMLTTTRHNLLKVLRELKREKSTMGDDTKISLKSQSTLELLYQPSRYDLSSGYETWPVVTKDSNDYLKRDR